MVKKVPWIIIFVYMKITVGKKIGSSRIFDNNGNEVAVTLVSVDPIKVLGIKKIEKDGYSAVVVGSINDNNDKDSKIHKTEFITSKSNDYQVGQELLIDQFKTNDPIQVEGYCKGKGFSGVIKRHGFSKGPKTHGSDHHRAVGSIGGAYPQRVVLGKKMPGRLGGKHVTIKNLKLYNVDKENSILAISGAIPGPKKSSIKIISS